MAKKTTSRGKSHGQPDAGDPAPPAPKPRARRAPKRPTVGADQDAGAADAIVDAKGRSDASVVEGAAPTEEDIRVRAYHRYLERGRSGGMEFEDWVEAERDLKQRK